jgi:hypothetical protein
MSNQTKHTPGPWTVDENYTDGLRIRGNLSHRKHDAVEEVVAKVYGPRENPDARLIAAAPELLEALKLAIAFFERHAKTPAEIKTRDAMIDAVAKATGGDR